MCKHCYIVKRGKIRYVYCKETPKHKQRQGFHTMVHGYMGDNCLLCNVTTTDLTSLYNNNTIISGSSNSSIELMGTRSMYFSSTILGRTMLQRVTSTHYTNGNQVYGTNEVSDSDIISSSINQMNMNRVTINYVPQLGLYSILNPIK